ncbi:hypothetical protein H4R24_003344 [Coemansia sp. RSA 988]|nr:hypothetical protein H4R24_003344 [Coemansia sp. RSA 988]
MYLRKLFYASISLFALVQGHISLISPCPRFITTGKNCPAIPAGQEPAQEINKPISSRQQDFNDPLCKFEKPWPTPVAKWTAGKSITVEFGQHAVSHSGGHCEFSVSYDGGKTFVVIHQELRYCFVGKKPASITNEVSVFSYTFDLPKDLPSSDKAVFAWTWVNASGNREFYMNCADVSIAGSSKSFTGKEMTIVNYKDYPTVPEFNMDYETGIKLYTSDAKNITVTSDGSGGAGPNDDDSEELSDTVSEPPADTVPDPPPAPQTDSDSEEPSDTGSVDQSADGTASGTVTSEMPTIMPTATNVPTVTTTATVTTAVMDGDSNKGTHHHGGMCCQNCCGCNGGNNGGWFGGMQNMGGYQQYGYYGPGYIVPDPGMDTVNNYFYANNNGGYQGQYQGGGQAGYQNGHQGGGQNYYQYSYGQAPNQNYPGVPNFANNDQMYGPPINTQASSVSIIQ